MSTTAPHFLAHLVDDVLVSLCNQFLSDKATLRLARCERRLSTLLKSRYQTKRRLCYRLCQITNSANELPATRLSLALDDSLPRFLLRRELSSGASIPSVSKSPEYQWWIGTARACCLRTEDFSTPQTLPADLAAVLPASVQCLYLSEMFRFGQAEIIVWPPHLAKLHLHLPVIQAEHADEGAHVPPHQQLFINHNHSGLAESLLSVQRVFPQGLRELTLAHCEIPLILRDCAPCLETLAVDSGLKMPWNLALQLPPSLTYLALGFPCKIQAPIFGTEFQSESSMRNYLPDKLQTLLLNMYPAPFDICLLHPLPSTLTHLRVHPPLPRLSDHTCTAPPDGLITLEGSWDWYGTVLPSSLTHVDTVWPGSEVFRSPNLRCIVDLFMYSDPDSDPLSWPNSLQSITFGDHFSGSLLRDHCGDLPVSLTELHITSSEAHGSLDHLHLPHLRILEVSDGLQMETFVSRCNALTTLICGPSAISLLPASLTSLNLNRYGHSLSFLRSHPNLKFLQLDVRTHPTLESSIFKQAQPLPPQLKSLLLYGDFNESIEAVQWPSSLTRLHLGGKFGQSVERLHLPETLEHLSLGSSFQVFRIREMIIPPNLIAIAFDVISDSETAQIVSNLHLPPSCVFVKFKQG